ncbi:MAG: HlyD family efflux transporter periplasmic adaptor subunit [Saprospiraceae bacterium]|nr:HlyD family efflux transporter periplasmic adaptor subunit [Saprospiraceae bacterium]
MKYIKNKARQSRRGEAIALLGSSDALYIQLEVDELDINKIKLGQEILVKIDVFKNQVFKAKVSKIYQMLNRQNQSFRVDAEFVGKYPNLYSGLTVEANIIIQEKPKALVIPKSLIVGDDSLWILKNNQAERIKIKKGIENFEWAEVQEGLDTTIKIIKK